MSDTFLRLVPNEPHWHPDETAATAAVKVARGLFPMAEHVAVEYEEGVTFFDAGANTESVHCPFCAGDLEDDPVLQRIGIAVRHHAMLPQEHLAERPAVCLAGGVRRLRSYGRQPWGDLRCQ